MTPYKLNSHQVFEAPAVAVLFFHNVYEEGKQGGLEIIQQSVRIAGNGNLRPVPAPDQWNALPKNGERRVLPDGSLQVSSEYAALGLRYTVRLIPEGKLLRLTVSLEKPLPAELVGQVGFSLEFIPDAYIGKSYVSDNASGIFPNGFDGAMVSQPGETLKSQALAQGRKLVLSPEDPATRLEIESLRGEIKLIDGRTTADNGWFVVHSPVPAGASRDAIEWRITPAAAPGWVRPPVICYSQVGYHPRQNKIAAIELDPSITQPKAASLVRLSPDGSAQVVHKTRLKLWGAYLYFHYALFNFSETVKPGLYRIEYDGQSTAVFPIAAEVYQRGVWQPTLETFMPVQMCHMEVRDRYRVWHGACHLDDALQAPLNQNHFDGYLQGSETETPYAPLSHIPHLDLGGWHDAGDYDLAAGSEARTLYTLALVRETFGLDSDQTTVDRANRKVILHQPDGTPDIVEQVIHGVENLLSGYRAAGHSFSGIIESNLKQYVHLGDPATMTDNRVTDGPAEKSDDRWAFTNRDTSLEYIVAAALTASSRALRGWDEALADECLQTARQAWEFEQTHPVKSARSAYIPGRVAVQEVLATAELLIATSDDTYRQRLLALAPIILENFESVGWAVARTLSKLDDPAFENQFHARAEAYARQLSQDAAHNPFGVPYTAETWKQQAPIWGIAWPLLQQAVGTYFLHQAYPDMVDTGTIVAVLNYVLGCHPVSNVSLVSGVGSKSLTIAYGINRADWTHVPGGVVAGPALLIPDYLELQDPFPYLWQQKEYVIDSAADFIFCVLAVDKLLAGKK